MKRNLKYYLMSASALAVAALIADASDLRDGVVRQEMSSRSMEMELALGVRNDDLNYTQARVDYQSPYYAVTFENGYSIGDVFYHAASLHLSHNTLNGDVSVCTNDLIFLNVPGDKIPSITKRETVCYDSQAGFIINY